MTEADDPMGERGAQRRDFPYICIEQRPEFLTHTCTTSAHVQGPAMKLPAATSNSNSGTIQFGLSHGSERA